MKTSLLQLLMWIVPAVVLAKHAVVPCYSSVSNTFIKDLTNK